MEGSLVVVIQFSIVGVVMSGNLIAVGMEFSLVGVMM
jgi:hypothetical protein